MSIDQQLLEKVATYVTRLEARGVFLNEVEKIVDAVQYTNGWLDYSVKDIRHAVETYFSRRTQ